ncbi:hypothetical protein ACWKWA_14610 [Dermacoccus abyssi]
MSETPTWRPLGVDDEGAIEQYDTLHEGIPNWMEEAFWKWLRGAFTTSSRDAYGNVRERFVQERLDEMSRALRVRIGDLANLRRSGADPLQMADFVLSKKRYASPDTLTRLLHESNSAWTVGTRNGFPGLVRRVPEGVQQLVDDLAIHSGRAGTLLGSAWGEAYGINGDPDRAYQEAVRAVEDITVPLVCPNDTQGTLGKVIAVFRDQAGKWTLPPSKQGEQSGHSTLLAMMTTLWVGQPRHAGQADQQVHATPQDAIMAVSLAAAIINIWHSGVVFREA